MEVLEAIRKRSSVRNYKDTPIPGEVLDRVLDAGRIAPSANNYQPWHFIVVTDPERRKALTDGKYAKFLTESPVVIVGCGDTRKAPEWCRVDVTIALQNMVTQATAEGLGTCWIGSFYEDKVKKALDIPDSLTVVAMLTVGYSAKVRSGERKTKSMEDIISWERYGSEK
jgi:nitroreductase